MTNNVQRGVACLPDAYGRTESGRGNGAGSSRSSVGYWGSIPHAVHQTNSSEAK